MPTITVPAGLSVLVMNFEVFYIVFYLLHWWSWIQWRSDHLLEFHLPELKLYQHNKRLIAVKIIDGPLLQGSQNFQRLQYNIALQFLGMLA